MKNDKINKFLDWVRNEYVTPSRFDDECWLEAVEEWNALHKDSLSAFELMIDEDEIVEIKKRVGRK